MIQTLIDNAEWMIPVAVICAFLVYWGLVMVVKKMYGE